MLCIHDLLIVKDVEEDTHKEIKPSSLQILLLCSFQNGVYV